VQVLRNVMIEKRELATSVEEKKSKNGIHLRTWTMLGMTNYFTGYFYLWRVG